MTREEKIEALAEELRLAFNKLNAVETALLVPFHSVTPYLRQYWTSIATIAQARIDAAGTRWTRVEDGLPKPGRKVQLTVEYENGVREVRRTRYLSRDEGWGDVGTYVRPLAWAPLPEPWRG